MSDKFCVDCKHCFLILNSDYGCRSPKLGRDVVTGKPNKVFCKNARKFDDLCKRDANWFEPKETAKEEPK